MYCKVYDGPLYPPSHPRVTYNLATYNGLVDGALDPLSLPCLRDRHNDKLGGGKTNEFIPSVATQPWMLWNINRGKFPEDLASKTATFPCDVHALS